MVAPKMRWKAPIRRRYWEPPCCKPNLPSPRPQVARWISKLGDSVLPLLPPIPLEIRHMQQSRAFRFAASPRLSYRAVVWTLEWPASCCAVEMSAAASSRSEVNDLLRSCGLKGATPASFARFLRIWSTAWSVMRWILILPPLFTLQNNGPLSTPRTTSQSFRASARTVRGVSDAILPTLVTSNDQFAGFDIVIGQIQAHTFWNVSNLRRKEWRSERHHEFRPATNRDHIHPSTQQSHRKPARDLGEASGP